MSALDIKAYEVFKSKFGEKEAAIVIEYFESKTEQKFQEKKGIHATKAVISELRLATQQGSANTKVDTIKWMVGSGLPRRRRSPGCISHGKGIIRTPKYRVRNVDKKLNLPKLD